MMWQIRQLEAFAMAVQAGGITRAAEKLNISQPAASKLISTLEDKCGFSLFVRNGNRLTITAEGELLYIEISRLFNSTEEIRAKAEEIREQKFGSLKIAAFPALSTRLLPKIMTSFLEEHPGVKPLMTSHTSHFLVEWMMSQKSDIGFSMFVDESHPGLSKNKVMAVDAVCVINKQHRLAKNEIINLNDLDGENFISLYINDKNKSLIDNLFSTHGFKPKIVAECQMTLAACAMVSSGAGVAITDPLSAISYSDPNVIVKKLDPSIIFDIWLVYPSWRPLSLIAKSFVLHSQSSLFKLLEEHGMNCSIENISDSLHKS